MKNIIRKCTMCDIKQPEHQGIYRCPTCNCWTCKKHIKEFENYGSCPSCWLGDNPCIVCNSHLQSITEVLKHL